MPNTALPLDRIVIRPINDTKGQPTPLPPDGTTQRQFMAALQLPEGQWSLPQQASLGARKTTSEPLSEEAEFATEHAETALPLEEALCVPPVMHWVQGGEQVAPNQTALLQAVSPKAAFEAPPSAISTKARDGTVVQKATESTVQSIMFGLREVSETVAHVGAAPVRPTGPNSADLQMSVDVPLAQAPRLAVEVSAQALPMHVIGHLAMRPAAPQSEPSLLAAAGRNSKDWNDIRGGSTLADALYSGGMATRAADPMRLAPLMSQLPTVLGQGQVQLVFHLGNGDGVPYGLERLAEGLPGATLTTNTASATVTPLASLPLAQSGTAQIAQAIATTNADRFEITLSPEELGRVRIQVHQTEMGLQVLISGERPETLDLLRKNIALLSRALSDLGYESTSFYFGEQGREQGSRTQGIIASSPMSLEDAPSHEMPPPPRKSHSSGLDLRF